MASERDSPEDTQGPPPPSAPSSSPPATPERIVEQLRPVLQPGAEETALRIVSHSVTEITEWSGAFPPATELEVLERFAPGFTREWLELVKSDQAASQELDRNNATRDYKIKRNGQHYAMAAVVVGALLCAYFAYANHANQAVALGVGFVLIVALGFLGEHVLKAYVSREASTETEHDDA